MSFKTISQVQLGQDTAKNSEIVTSSIIVFNSGGGSDVGGPTIANVVVTDSNYSNTFGNITVSNCFIKIFGTGFVSNTTVLVNANTAPTSNVAYVSSSELRVALPIISNVATVTFNVLNPGVPKFTKTAPPPPPSYSINYLVVAGGGAGYQSGGGGAGGVVCGSTTVTTGSSYTITIGAGGAYTTNPAIVPGGNIIAGNTKICGTGVVITALGGGYGGAGGQPGGSGGGAWLCGVQTVGSALQPGQAQTVTAGAYTNRGFPGVRGTSNGGDSAGGGGGAGAVGSPNGTGGAGYTWPYTGNTYAGGGGGIASHIGGTGGGGTAGTLSIPGSGGNATYYGGGGGGWGTQAAPGTAYYTSGSGYPGLVILAVPVAAYPGSAAGATVTCAPASYPGVKLLTYVIPGGVATPTSTPSTYTFIA